MSKISDSHIRRLDEKTNEPVLDHEYDGIEELDNPLPGWWLATFYITIVFAAFYFSWQNIFAGGHVHEEAYRADQARLDAKIAAVEAEAAKNFDATKLAAELGDKALVAPGAAVFKANCVTCHGPAAGGVVGPNLTDDYWIHGDGSPVEIWKVVDKGVPEKAMPSWGALIKPEEVKQVVAYVVSLHGSHPANARPPQGKKVK